MSVPILIYHRVLPFAKKSTDVNVISLQTFYQQMEFLHHNGYKTLGLDEYDAPENQNSKSVCITFDDATLDHWVYVHPVLEKFSIHATLFVPTSKIEHGAVRACESLNEISDAYLASAHSRYCSWEELKEMKRRGNFSLESHAHRHEYIVSTGATLGIHTPSTSTDETLWGKPIQTFDSFYGSPEVNSDKTKYAQVLRQDLQTNMDLFEENLGHRPYYIAWPFGIASSEALQVAKELGFKKTFLTEKQNPHHQEFAARRIHFGDDYRGIWQERVHTLRFIQTIESECKVGVRFRVVALIFSLLRKVKRVVHS